MNDVPPGGEGPEGVGLEPEELSLHIGRLARLGRQRDFSLARFRRSLAGICRNGEAAEVLRQLLTDWTGMPHNREEAEQRWSEIEQLLTAMRQKLGPPLGLQTVLLHYFHSRAGLLEEPRLVSDRDLSVLRVNSITDPLTGLYNRRFLFEHLAREIARAERADNVISLLLMDLEGFKSVNDRFGHPVGDSVLVRTARLIRESLRVIDAGCRWGGDEFVIVLPNTDLLSGFGVAERIRKRVGETALPGRTGIRMGMHYGIACYPPDGKTVDFLLKIADLRLYKCREQTNFKGRERRLHPRFEIADMSMRFHINGHSRAYTVPVVDMSFRGLAFRAKRKEKWPEEWTAEIFQRHERERHPVRIRPIHCVPASGGGVRVGCSYD